MSGIEERAEDYLAMGVPMVWIVDPKTRTAFQKNKLGFEAVEEQTMPNPGVQAAVAKVFAELDRSEGVMPS